MVVVQTHTLGMHYVNTGF